MSDITVRRTGRIYTFAGVEYVAYFPDGSKTTIWSPPWGDPLEDYQKDAGALEYAKTLWDSGDYTSWDRGKAKIEFAKWLGDGPELTGFLDKFFPVCDRDFLAEGI